jgi:hypothetical protein
VGVRKHEKMDSTDLKEKSVEAYQNVLAAAVAREHLLAATMERENSGFGREETFRVPG